MARMRRLLQSSLLGGLGRLEMFLLSLGIKFMGFFLWFLCAIHVLRRLLVTRSSSYGLFYFDNLFTQMLS